MIFIQIIFLTENFLDYCEAPLDVQLRTNVGGAVIKISKLRGAEATYFIGMIKISTTVGIVIGLDIYAYCHENHDSNDL